ncbi:TIGR03668 family PPOX class F420-dependent oxidoreductase [Nonomuraea diastatica]|uniref:TIGR03668 family PPOX class F420-dependent oxidoreductase n=1 Tax=Nonomuraea diastatica TaxID=1848329 RepID=A0A4R4WE73_9ACTN|nr:TIGR03668 family PPOX class F420-dependent oxidoreductase [Nonomuraea diastatica]TDD14543.1 TIGR03668 family PPOX class F420-dependent oxidoreductase [Nonomuraea diastatica]
MDRDRARDLFAGERVARLATVSGGGVPHLVPVTFAVSGDDVAIAVDHKPKSATRLRRLRNIEENPCVCLLADRYDDEEWARLWWVRADGRAAIVSGGPDRDRAMDDLVTKYAQYHERRPQGPVILVNVSRWSGWAYSD